MAEKQDEMGINEQNVGLQTDVSKERLTEADFSMIWHIFFGKFWLLMQKQHRLKLGVRAHILDSHEGLWATLSSCSKPSSHSYIVNEQERARKNEKQHRSGFWRAGWDDIIPISKPQRASVSLTRWEYEQGPFLSIKKSIQQENIVWD